MAATQLSSLDTAFLCLDSRSTPMNVGAVATFAPRQPVHPARIAELLAIRARRIPRLRQRVRATLLPPAAHWLDDPDFDASAHIHTHHLRRPHDTGQLTDLVATIMGERLDPHRPLWEIHVITGLPGGCFAVLPKLHHALADGAGALALGLGLLDGHEAAARQVRPPAPAGAGALLSDLGSTAMQALDIAGSVLRSARPAPPVSPLLTQSRCTRRRMATARLDMHDIKRVRAAHGGTTNDVLLAVLAGALRDWLLARGDRPDELAPRALVPVSQRCRGRGNPAGNQLSGYLCDLPVAEPDPVRRLTAVRAMMDGNKSAGPGRGPGALPVLADRLPAALHRVVMPMVGQCAPLLCDTVVTTVPLPGVPLAFDGAELREVYPVVPLAPGHALAVAFSPYRGTVHVGLTANGEVLPDVDQLAGALSGTLGSLNALCA